MEEEIFAILEKVVKDEKEASKQDASESIWAKRVNHFAYYPNKERFKERYMNALKERFPSIVPDENAISFIVAKELSCAYLAEEMGRDHTDTDLLEIEIKGQIEALFEARKDLAKNIITANQIVSSQNGIDESLLETLRANEFGGEFIDPTLNYAYQSYCEILRLQQKNGKQQQALTQGMSSIKALIGIVQDLNNDRYHQNEVLTNSITSLETAQTEITALSGKFQEEKAKGFFSKFFDKFRKSKYFPVENTVKDPSSRVSQIITKLKSAASKCENIDEYERKIEEHRTVLKERKQDKKNEQGSKSTTSNQKDNFSLQMEYNSSTENTHPNTSYTQQNHRKLQELQEVNARQQQTIDMDTQDIENLLELIAQLKDKYKEPNTAIKQSANTLCTAKQKIDELSKELTAEKEKTFVTRLVETIKKIGVSISREDESPDKGTSDIVSQVITNLTAVTTSYSATFDNENFTQISSRLHEREQSVEAQLGKSAVANSQEL